MPGTKVRSLGHVRPLDGLRGLLFLMVLSAHLEPWPDVVGGQVAMSAFFALSGFLITALLLTEEGRSGRVSLTNFYRRRALRLGPALVAMLAVWLIVVAVAGSHGWLTTVPGSSSSGRGEPMSVALQGVVVAVFYVTNWWTLAHLFTGYVPLGHLWSLAVEEQFYVLWAPILGFLLARRRRWSLPLTLGAAGVSLILPLVMWDGGKGVNRIYNGTDTRAAALLLGCAAAMAWHRGWFDRLTGPSVAVLTGASVGMLVVAGTSMHNGGSELAWVGGWVLASVGSPLLVAMLVVAKRGFARSLLSGRLIVYVGQRSYALYLWHYLYATWFNDLNVPGYALTVAASFITAELSWRLVEAPFLARKARLGAKAKAKAEAKDGRVPAPVPRPVLVPVGAAAAADLPAVA